MSFERSDADRISCLSFRSAFATLSIYSAHGLTFPSALCVNKTTGQRLCETAHAEAAAGCRRPRAGGELITWAGQRAGLAQHDQLVSVHRQLQAAAQLLVHRAALGAAGAVRHEARQVPVAGAVAAHHALPRGRRLGKRRGSARCSERG